MRIFKITAILLAMGSSEVAADPLKLRTNYKDWHVECDRQKISALKSASGRPEYSAFCNIFYRGTDTYFAYNPGISLSKSRSAPDVEYGERGYRAAKGYCKNNYRVGKIAVDDQRVNHRGLSGSDFHNLLMSAQSIETEIFSGAWPDCDLPYSVKMHTDGYAAAHKAALDWITAINLN